MSVLAPNGHAEPHDECRLSGVKRSDGDIAKSSLLDPERDSGRELAEGRIGSILFVQFTSSLDFAEQGPYRSVRYAAVIEMRQSEALGLSVRGVHNRKQIGQGLLTRSGVGVARAQIRQSPIDGFVDGVPLRR